MEQEIYLGFDPGGDKRFGVAILMGKSAQYHTVSSVSEAFEWAREKLGGSSPKAAGIDAILHWSTSRGGLRPADRCLQNSYRDTNPLNASNSSIDKSVLYPNSLRGAMCIGGMALAFELKSFWPEIVINETHPKVYAAALARVKKAMGVAAERINGLAMLREGLCDAEIPLEGSPNDHEQDAIWGALTTREVLKLPAEERIDLATLECQNERIIFPISATYYWPRKLLNQPAP